MGHQGKSLYNTMFLLSKILQCSPQKKHINESFSLTLAKILNKGLDKQTLDKRIFNKIILTFIFFIIKILYCISIKRLIYIKKIEISTSVEAKPKV